MNVVVVGAGGVGGYFGGRLHQSALCDVTFLLRPGSSLHDGLHIDSIAGNVSLPSVRWTSNVDDVRSPVDVIIVTVKTYQLADVAPRLKALVGPDTTVVAVQNGIDAVPTLAAELGEECLVAGVVKIVSFATSPGRIVHRAPPAGDIVLGGFAHNRERHRTRLDALSSLLSKCVGVTASISADIDVDLWKKLMLISSFSGIGSVTRAPRGVLLSQPETRDMLYRAMLETQQVAAACGVNVPRGYVDELFGWFDTQAGAPGITTSMMRDIMSGKPSELDSLVGAVVRLGAARGAEPQLLKFVYHALLPLERQARGEITFPLMT